MSAIAVEATDIPDVKIIIPRKFADPRGFFSETYNRKAYADAGIALDFVQDNQSLSTLRGTVRGLHFQSPPFAQDKLIRVLRGSIYDVAVDLRRSSPSYGRHVGVELSAQNWRQLLVPAGFAHGFVTLEADVEVAYKVTGAYSAAHDLGLAWDDPDLGIRWPLDGVEPALSDKDRRHPRLRDLAPIFD